MTDKRLELKRKIEAKYFFWAFFYFHLALFIAVNALLVTSNFLVSPGQLWFVIPLASWGVFVFAQFFITFFLAADSSKQWRDAQIKKASAEEKELGVDEQEARRLASTKLFFWMFFYFHLAIFIGGNTIIIIINLLTDPKYLWFLIPFIGWGLWLLFHFFLTFLCLGDQVKYWRFRRIKKLTFGEEDTKEIRRDAFLRFFFWNLFYLHLAIYILCNIMMISINLIMNPDAHWFIWPLLAWGLFLLFHFGLTYVTASPMIVRWREEQLRKVSED